MKRQFDYFTLTKRKALFLGVVIFAWINLSSAQDDAPNVFLDQDQDQLTDQEELALGTDPQKADTDGDGYDDGKEVESGYDPTIAAPGDKLVPEAPTDPSRMTSEELALIDDGVNITDDFIEKLQEAKGDELSILQELSSNPQKLEDPSNVEALQNISLTGEEVDSLLASSINEAAGDDEMVLLDESEIKVLDEPVGKDDAETKELEKKQIEEYFVAVGYILLQNAPFEAQNEGELKEKSLSFINEFNDIIAQGDITKLLQFQETAGTAYEGLKELEAPYLLKDIHLRGLSIFKYMLEQNVGDMVDQEDPLSLVLMIGKVQSAADELQSLGLEVESILQEYGISTFSSSTEIQEKVESDLTSPDDGDDTDSQSE